MASLSKREQARNESALQDLLRQPGNSTCADCGARNPSWASWNLGVFLCMRCASIHRKLGTHISKVKSLSMDKWTTEQVESMKQQGNIASNKIYNPKNKRPDIPLDADEVDSAMERFIRKKYQEKSLVDGRPEPPSRADASPSVTQSQQPSPNPDLSSTHGKKHKFFGFSLRASSKKERPGMHDAFKVTPVEYSPTSGRVREVPEIELQQKLVQLADMGFRDNERNLDILKRSGGDLESTIATLVKLGPTTPSGIQTAGPAPQAQSTAPAASAPSRASVSNNPFDQLQRPQPATQQSSGFGLSFDAPQSQSQASPTPNANPWQSAMPSQPPQATGLEQQFSTMQVSNPLFPHHTGGYAQQSVYQDPRLQTMTPPVPSIPQQGGHAASSTPSSNPFYQQPLSSQSTGTNPFLQQQQSLPVFAPQTHNNPFLGIQQPQSQPSTSNPFGLPPPPRDSQQQPPQSVQSLSAQTQAVNPFGLPPQASPPLIQQSQTFPLTQTFSQTSPFAQLQQQPQTQQAQQAQLSQPQMPNLNYGQPPALSPFQQPQQGQQAFYQNQEYSQQQSQPPSLQPQATGRYTKTDIMALFNAPSPAFQQQPLAPVQEAPDNSSQQQFQTQPQQSLSPAPSNNPYGSLSPATGKRSTTMPLMSSMHSFGGTGSRNPFVTQASSTTASSVSPASTPFGQQLQIAQAWNQGHRHASNESVSVNNPGLMDGRHSPDAFANLSARY